MSTSFFLTLVTFPLWFTAFVVKSLYSLIRLNCVFLWNTLIMLYRLPDIVIYSFEISVTAMREDKVIGGK